MPSCISPLYIYTKNPVNSSCNNPFDIPMIFRFHPGFRLSQDLQVTMPWKALVLSFALNCRRSEKSKQTHRGDHGLSLFVVWGSVKKGGWGSQRKGEFMGLAWKVWEMPHISSSKMGWNMVQAHQKIKLSFCGKMQGFLKSTFRIRLAIFNFGTPVWDRNVLYSDWTKKNRNLLASTIKSWKIWCVNSSKVWLISPVICVWSKDQKLKKKIRWNSRQDWDAVDMWSLFFEWKPRAKILRASFGTGRLEWWYLFAEAGTKSDTFLMEELSQICGGLMGFFIVNIHE